MADKKAPIDIGAFGHGLILRKARQLSRRPDFFQEDPRDLEQELITRLLKRLRKFNPRQGQRDHFISVVVKRIVANLLRDRRAKAPRDRKVVSLSACTNRPCGDPTRLAASVTQDDLDARLGRRRRSPAELAELVMDIETMMEGLSDADREIVESLKTKSRSATARDRAVPRSSQNDALRPVRERFERAGLKEYL